jgi:glycosyltransferase involved in cell wall biosynthesis
LEVIPNGIDTARFAPNAITRRENRQELGLPENVTLIMFCGRLDPMKRPELALEILTALLSQKQDVHLLIIGEGALRQNLEKRSRELGVTHRLSMLGFKEEVAPYMAASDLYLSTSTKSEGFSLTTSEALSAGLPAFVPDHPVFRSCYSTCASVRLIDSDNPMVWAKEIATFMSGESQRVMSARRAREYALDHLSDVAMKNQLCTFYRSTFSKLSLSSSGI